MERVGLYKMMVFVSWMDDFLEVLHAISSRKTSHKFQRVCLASVLVKEINMPSANPLISIIVPVFNVQKSLNRCIESLIAQTYTMLEIILVDDGSTDGSGQLCDDWLTRDSRVKVIHKSNGGLSDARNAGIDASHGDYLVFC